MLGRYMKQNKPITNIETMKIYYIDGEPLENWTDIVKMAKDYGYDGDRDGVYYTSSASKVLRDNGHTVEYRYEDK